MKQEPGRGDGSSPSSSPKLQQQNGHGDDDDDNNIDNKGRVNELPPLVNFSGIIYCLSLLPTAKR